MNLTNYPQKNIFTWVVVGLISVACVGAVDFWTGPELAFSLFYLLPILLVTWHAGRNAGLILGFASAVTWFVADSLAGQSYSQPIIGYWNAGIRLGFFVVVTLLLPALKELEYAKRMARIDYLTGCANRRFFFEAAQRELARFQRYKQPFAMVYMDIDGFKAINDQFGHESGDELLRLVAAHIKKYLRKTDTVARIGGDEFALLLPGSNQILLRVIISRMQAGLLDEMQRNDWPVTFSFGVLIYCGSQTTSDELLKKADELMYVVKNNGKNSVAYSVYGNQTF